MHELINAGLYKEHNIQGLKFEALITLADILPILGVTGRIYSFSKLNIIGFKTIVAALLHS